MYIKNLTYMIIVTVSSLQKDNAIVKGKKIGKSIINMVSLLTDYLASGEIFLENSSE